MRQRWQDEDFRKRNADATREMLAERWQDEDFRKRHADATREKWQDEDFRKRHADATREKWQDEDFRKRHADATRDPWLAGLTDEEHDDYIVLRAALGADEARASIERNRNKEKVTPQTPTRRLMPGQKD